MRSIKIPVRFQAGNEARTDTFDVPVSDVALVLIDWWNYGDPKEGEDPPVAMGKTQAFLGRCRDAGMTIIHAPNHPVVDKYPQYEAIRDEVKAWLAEQPGTAGTGPHLDWPDRDNDVYTKARAMRHVGAGSQDDRDISRLLRPLPDEYVLATHDEFRYVLWQKGIKLLLYTGGALNECVQHRDTGINLLIGTDTRRTAFTVVFVEDCCTAIGSPKLSAEGMRVAMLEYFQRKIGFVAESGGVTVTTQDRERVSG